MLSRLAAGETLSGIPLAEGQVDDPSLAGLVPPGRRCQFLLAYPHYMTSAGGRPVAMTHGHYLDRIQTGGIALAAVVHADDQRSLLRHLCIATAQYQTVAHATAIRRRVRKWTQRVYLPLAGAYERVCGLRGHALSRHVRVTIDTYITHVARVPSACAFVVGHTHVPGKWATPEGLRI